MGKELQKVEPRTGNLQHGRRSQFLKTFGSCSLCPVRDYCLHKELLSHTAQERGCDDIRRLFFENIRQWKKPVTALIRSQAEIQTRVQMQQLKDGHDNKITSKEWFKLKELELKLANAIIKYDPSAANQSVRVEHVFSPGSNEIIELDPSAYDSDEISDDKPVAHGNLGDKKMERLKERGS